MVGYLQTDNVQNVLRSEKDIFLVTLAALGQVRRMISLAHLFQLATRISMKQNHRRLNQTVIARRTVLPVWSGKSTWLWSQWRGTILEATWGRMLGAMALSALVITATVWTAPPESR